jgi:hypothetical protein
MKKPKVRCPSMSAFRLIPKTYPDDLNVIEIDRCCGSILTTVGTPLFQRWPIKYHAHFSGARSPPVTCNKSRKNCIMSPIRGTKLSSSCVSPRTEDGIGSRFWLSSVAPVVVSSMNESPRCVSVVVPSTDTSDMQSNYLPSTIRSSWLSRAHIIGDEQFPWLMPYNSLSIVLLYEVSDTPHPVATWCSSWAHRRPNIRTEFLE